MPPEALEKFEQQLGLAKAPELDLIRNCWQGARSILELGAGEGRVIDGLLQHNYLGGIYAIERHTIFFKQLQEKYRKNTQITIIEGDLLNPEMLPKAEVGLWLWAGIMEFSPQEQRRVLQNLEQSIEKTLIVETPMLGSKTNATVGEEQWLEIRRDNHVFHGYLPSEDEIHTYTLDTQWHIKEMINYEFVKNKKRMLYVFQRQKI